MKRDLAYASSAYSGNNTSSVDRPKKYGEQVSGVVQSLKPVAEILAPVVKDLLSQLMQQLLS